MDKQTIIEKIQAAGISEGAKREFIALVEGSQTIDAEFMEILQNAIGRQVEELAGQVADLQIGDAADEFNGEMEVLQKEADEFARDLDAKARDVDVASAREQLKG